MKLFQQLLVAPAALGLLAPMAANASDLNISGVSDYSAASEQVTSASDFSDVQPTDWAFQALARLADRYGCAFNADKAISRFEAAALLNECLDGARVSDASDKRLLKEFSTELATIRGQFDGMEAKVGELGSSTFSTTTKLNGETVFVIGGVSYEDRTKAGKSDDAVSFTYATRLDLDTQFADGGFLKTRLSTGNFANSPWNGDAFLERAYASGDKLTVDRNYYKFNLSDSVSATVGAVVRQDDMLAVWPSAYPSDSVLDVLTYAGANAAYSLAEGAGAGINYLQDNFSASLAVVSDEGSNASQGILTDQGSDDLTAQVAWVGDNYTFAAVYTTSDGGNTSNTADANDYDAWGLSGVYNLDNGISVSAGMGWKTPEKESDASDIEDENTWTLGVVWSDFGVEGNDLGVAVGTAEGHRDDSGYDDPLAYEVYYKMTVSDNITVTPALFVIEQDGDDKNFSGGLVKTTFIF